MLMSLKHIFGVELSAKDGRIGKLDDALFDDVAWTLRYFVADTGKWLPGQLVLLPPQSAHRPNFETRRLPVDLTKRQIEQSPPIQEDAPVSRQMEIPLLTHYGWEPYWPVTMAHPRPQQMARELAEEADAPGSVATAEQEADPDLRSTNEVTGYHIEASDGSIGHVDDFVVCDESWVIRYMVVDTRNWLPGRKVIISPAWIENVRWRDHRVQVAMQRDEIRNSPRYDPAQPINRAYERRVYDYYGRPVYWTP